MSSAASDDSIDLSEDDLQSRLTESSFVDSSGDDQELEDAWRDFEETKEARTIPDKVIKEVQSFVRKKDTHKLKQSIVRNVLVLGRTRAGKTTFVEQLKSITHQAPMPSVFSDTRNPKCTGFAIETKEYCEQEKKRVEKNYFIQIVDTPGIFEVNPEDGDQPRKNSFIKRCIRGCLHNEIAKIHCVFIFLNVQGGINYQDVEAIKIFLNDFGSDKVTACLVITHAERYDEAQKKQYREEIMKYPGAHDLIKTHNVQILFSGCIDPAQYTTKNALAAGYKNLYDMRKKTFDVIFGAHDEGAHLSSLRAVQASTQATLKLAEACRTYLVEVTNKVHDFSQPEQEKKLEAHLDNMQMLTQESPLLLRDVKITPIVKDIELKLRKAAHMYDKSTVEKLSGSFKFTVTKLDGERHARVARSSSWWGWGKSSPPRKNVKEGKHASKPSVQFTSVRVHGAKGASSSSPGPRDPRSRGKKRS